MELLADTACRFFKNHSLKTSGKNFNAESGWVLLDFGSCIAHFFLPETREFYNLEKLYFEGEITEPF
ncbi:MAG TPA: hypothetical protein DC049_10445 [Spirochaetia bacterium]|nr:hypothetical protein [Spirochaetia bacterium]